MSQVSISDLKEFTLETKINGPERMVSFSVGEVVITGPALVVRGLDVAEAWDLVQRMRNGLFTESDPELSERDEEEEAPPPKKKRKRRTKAQIKADEEAKLREQEKKALEAVGGEEVTENDDEEEEEEEEADTTIDKDFKRAMDKDDADDDRKVRKAKKSKAKAKTKKAPAPKNGKSESTLDLEDFVDMQGLREVVSTLKDEGRDREETISGCIELQRAGLSCLKGVAIERRVKKIWSFIGAE